MVGSTVLARTRSRRRGVTSHGLRHRLCSPPTEEALSPLGVTRMGDKRSRRAIRRSVWLVGAVLVLAVGLGLVAGTPRTDGPAPDNWTVLVRTGDALAA